jgi:hypothetical protein
MMGAARTSETLVNFYSSPWWWRQQGPLKRWWTSTRLHGATTQKTAISVVIFFVCYYQRIWQTAYNRIFRVRQIIVYIYFHAKIESALEAGLLYTAWLQAVGLYLNKVMLVSLHFITCSESKFLHNYAVFIFAAIWCETLNKGRTALTRWRCRKWINNWLA